MTALVIDTDPGVDDAMAILYALADPEVELLGLTTVFGNVPGGMALRNALQLVELAEADIPVAEGAHGPLAGALQPDARHVHGPEGFGEVRLPAPTRRADGRRAADFLAETCAARPGEVTVVSVGPLTNLAHALDRHPEIAETVGAVMVMGGAVRRGGNVTPHAEANIHQDPHAAERVFDAPWPVSLMPLDLTERITCTAADIAPMVAASPTCGAFLTQAAEFYFAFHRASEGLDGCHLHDPTALIAALDPGLVRAAHAPVAVTLEGDAAGMTRERASGPMLTLCLDGDIPQIRDRFLAHLTSGRLP